MKRMVVFLLFAVMVMAGMAISCDCGASNEVADKIATPIDNIFERKSVRSFEDKRVSKDTLELLVKAGMAAPSAMNRQPWQFFVSTDKVKMDSLNARLPYAKMLKEAAAAIVVLGNPEISKLWMYDCSACTQNVLLAAESLGLGAVWTAAFPYDDRVNAIKEVYAIPDPWLPLALIPVGYPKGDYQPKDKWDPAKVHYEIW
ncbi:MAG: nitroreductase family protein [Bacteroidales bacterium]|nr:nitroreductase family protein [Bacteroidales bacterium]